MILLGTPAALRGIREVTDKNKHILLEAVFNGDFIPDHLLPVGIHRCGQAKWRAHLCTVGLKFSGPPRDNVRDACEDRRRFCEENGVNFVLYGKQTHAKGPIGSRPSMPSTFPRLSDYISSVSRAGGGGGKDGQGGVYSVISGIPQLKGFMDIVESTKKVIEARQAEERGETSYHVSKSHAELHKRIVEDSKDQPLHMFSRIHGCNFSSGIAATHGFNLCPVRLQPSEGVVIRFVWSSLSSINDPSLYSYLDSILVNASPPINQFERSDMIRKLVSVDVASQLLAFVRLNERIEEAMISHTSFDAAIKHVHQTAPHVISTRKAHNVASVTANMGAGDPTDPFIEIEIVPGTWIKWNSLSNDSIAEDFAVECENEFDNVVASDVLYALIEGSYRRRIGLFYGPQGPPKKPVSLLTPVHAPIHTGLNVSEEDIQVMNQSLDRFIDQSIRAL